MTQNTIMQAGMWHNRYESNIENTQMRRNTLNGLNTKMSAAQVNTNWIIRQATQKSNEKKKDSHLWPNNQPRKRLTQEITLPWAEIKQQNEVQYRKSAKYKATLKSNKINNQVKRKKGGQKEAKRCVVTRFSTTKRYSFVAEMVIEEHSATHQNKQK